MQEILMGSSHCGSVVMNPTSIHEDMGWIWYCHELWHRLQMQLGSGTTVAVMWASNCSSDLTPSLGNLICCGCGPKKTKKKKKKKKVDGTSAILVLRKYCYLWRNSQWKSTLLKELSQFQFSSKNNRED